MENNTQFNASYGLIASIQAMQTASLQELWEELTPDNVEEFLSLIETELESREVKD